ncbi:hypothetical protein [Arvimicrobium flavum]|nr:hypothetical protein [Mesorhizobium shangrilense]
MADRLGSLPLDGVCHVCERSVLAALGEEPPPLLPGKDFCFS